MVAGGVASGDDSGSSADIESAIREVLEMGASLTQPAPGNAAACPRSARTLPRNGVMLEGSARSRSGGVRRLLAAVTTLSMLATTAGSGAAAATSPEPLASSTPPAISCTQESEPNDRPEDAVVLSSELCLTGTLPEQSDQDLMLWDVLPAEALITWRFTIEGIPTTITSLYLFSLYTEPGVFPVEADQMFRLDTDATSPTPGVQTGVSLPTGRYLLGISRGDPARGEAPPGEYHVTIEHEQPPPPLGDLEPNDDAASASPVGNPIDLSGAAEGDPDFYRWTLSEAEAADRWQLGLRGVPGESLALALQSEDGTPLATTTTSAEGEARLYDLQLPAGAYDIVVSGSGVRPIGYFLTSSRSQAQDTDAEPNDAQDQAVPIAIGERRGGRLAGPRDVDRYIFTVPEADAGNQVDVAMKVGSALDRQLCLTLLPDQEIGCRRGKGDIELSDLLLAAGSYLIAIDGYEDLDASYELSVADIGPVSADREVEPNDDPATATLFDPSQVMHGRSASDDTDYFKVSISGDRQIWRLDATGTDIRELLWLEPNLMVRGSGDISADGTRASLWDMDLVPGDHWVAIRSDGRDYELTLTPQGATAAGTEREPNNDSANAEALEMDHSRTGRLPGPADTDVYRFSLEATERVTIRLDPPPDAGIRMRLTTGTQELARVRYPAPGVPIVYETELYAGDYEVALQSDVGSALPYTLQLDRKDPFTPETDLEPNDTMAAAEAVPPSLQVTGRGFGEGGEDHDWYMLPALTSEASVTIASVGDVTISDVRDGSSGVRVERGEDGTTWTTDPVPEGTVLYVSATGTSDYSLAFTSDGLDAQPPAGELPVVAELMMAEDGIAAYTEFGQRVPAVLRITSDSSSVSRPRPGPGHDPSRLAGRAGASGGRGAGRRDRRGPAGYRRRQGCLGRHPGPHHGPTARRAGPAGDRGHGHHAAPRGGTRGTRALVGRARCHARRT